MSNKLAKELQQTYKVLLFREAIMKLKLGLIGSIMEEWAHDRHEDVYDVSLFMKPIEALKT